jgi:sulfopyruvate decarboxylase subunit alpha
VTSAGTVADDNPETGQPVPVQRAADRQVLEQQVLERRSAAVIAGIEAVDPDHVLHLASSTLKTVLAHFIDGPGARPGRRVFAMPREEEGVAIAAGLELAGARPVLIFQDNGIGNLLTALLTLCQPYHLPLLAVVTRRGGLGEYNSMIHAISERAEALLDAAGVRWFQLDGRTPVERWAAEIERAWAFARATHRPVFVLVNLMGS